MAMERLHRSIPIHSSVRGKKENPGCWEDSEATPANNRDFLNLPISYSSLQFFEDGIIVELGGIDGLGDEL
jgi:hypothetical protein